MRFIHIYIMLLLFTGICRAQYKFEWENRYSNDTTFYAKALTLGPSNEIFITGILRNGHNHAWIKKLDDSGRVKLTIIYSRYKACVPNSITTTPDSSVVIAGYARTSENDEKNIWVAKFDLSGRLLWERVFRQFGNSYAVKVISTSQNDLIIAANTAEAPFKPNDWLILKLDSLGFIKWKKQSGSPYDDKVDDLALLADGSYAMSGFYRTDKGRMKVAAVSIIDSSGNEIYFKNFYQLKWSEATAITGTQDTNLVVTGYFKNLFDRNNIFLQKISPYGDVLWADTLQMPYQIIPFSLIEAFDKSLVLAFTLWKGEFPYTDLGIAQYTPEGKLKFLRLMRRGSDDFVAQLIESKDNGIYLLASVYVYDLGWVVSLIKCATTKKSDLYFLTPKKKLTAFYKDSLLFKVCIKGYEVPQKVVIKRNGKIIDSVTTFRITGEDKCPFYFEKKLPLKFGYNHFIFRVTDYRGYIFERKRTVIYTPLPFRKW